MRHLISAKLRLLAAGTALLWLAGCASTPAPVVNHSFGPGEPAPAPVPVPQPASPGGAQTFGLGHANGTTSAAGYTVAPGDTLYSIAFAHGLDFRALAADNNIPPPYTIHPGQVLKLTAPSPAPAPAVAVAAPVPVPPAPVTSAPPSAPVFGPVTTQPMTASGVAPAGSSTVVAPVAAQPPPRVPATAPAPSTPPASPVVAATPTPPPGKTRSVSGVTWRWPADGEVIGGFRNGAGGDGAGVDIAGKLGEPVRAAASGTVVYSGDGLIGYGELVIIKHNDTYLSAYGHNSKRLVKEGQHVNAGQEIALMGASGAPRVELHFEIRKSGKPVDPADYLPAR